MTLSARTMATHMTSGLPRSGQEDVGPPNSRGKHGPSTLLATGESDSANIIFVREDEDNDELSSLSEDGESSHPSPVPSKVASPVSMECLTPSRSCGPVAAVTPIAPQTAISRPVAPQCTYRLTRLLFQNDQQVSQVHRATVLSSNIPAAPRGAQVAVKIYDTSRWKSDEFKNARGEINAMAKLRHPNIVTFYSCKYEAAPTAGPRMGYGHTRSATSIGGQGKPHIAIVQELCSRNDLHDNVRKYGAMPENLAKHYSRELLNAVEFMHFQRVAHRDIKLDNIVLSHAWVLKVCDFGHATEWDVDVVKPLVFHCAGTESYRSPELQAKVHSWTPASTTNPACRPSDELDFKNWYDPRATDAWSVGVVCFELLLGYPPMCTAQANDWYYDKISKGKWDVFWAQHSRHCSTLSAEQAAKLTPTMRSFFEAVFCPCPKRRLTVTQMLAHPYLCDELEIPADELSTAMQNRCSR